MALPSNPPTGPGIKSLQKIQIAKESTLGTASTSDMQILRVPGGTLSDERQVTMVDEMVGIVNGTDRSYIAAAQGSISVDSSPLTPEQFPILLAASLGFDGYTGRTSTTAGELDGVSAYRYTCTLPTTTILQNSTVAATGRNVAYTFVAGDSFEVEQMTYGKCTNVSVSGSSGGPLSMQGSFIGRNVSYYGATFPTDVASISAVEDLIFSRAILSLAEPAGSPTFTTVDSTFLGFDVGIDCTWVPKYTGQGDNATTPTWEFALFTNYAVNGSFTLEHNSWTSGTANGLKQKWRDQETLIMRIDCWGRSVNTLDTTGSTLTPTSPFSPSANSTYQGVRFEFPIKIQQISPLSDNDGNNIVSVAWSARYNSTYGSTGYILVENDISELFPAVP